MKQSNQNLIWVSIATLALAGCGSSSNDSKQADTDDHDHEHEHSILVSQSTTDTLSLLEEGELESLDDSAAGNGASFVLGETGAYAAVLSNTTVNFVHGLHEEEDEAHEEEGDEAHEEAHVLDFSLTASKVITTNGHFAVLDAGSTTFVAYDELEKETPETENASSLSVVETYPALILEEEHDLKLLFNGTNAVAYEGATQEHSFACATPTHHGQTSELIVVSCGNQASALIIEENETTGEHTFTDSALTLDGTATNYVWRAQGHVVVGFEPNTKNYAVIELDDSENLVVVKGSDASAFAFTQNICEIKLDSESQDILAVTAAGNFTVLNHEGEKLKAITLDESAASDCDDFVMASASKTALVLDNRAQKGYEIDVDEPTTNPNGYHVHERFNLGVSDISDMVIFHEKDEDDHNHDH